MTQLVKIENAPELSGVEQNKAEQIKATFAPMVEMLNSFEERYAELIKTAQEGIDATVCASAKRLRLDIAKVRINADKARKEIKDEYLRAGKAIDGANNILKWAVVDRENKLKEIETHFERLEEQRLEALQAERVSQLAPYVEDAHERDLATMEQDVWDAYFAAKKQAYEDKIEAERKAAEARIEAERKQKLEWERGKEMARFTDLIELPDNLADLSEKQYDALKAKANKAMEAELKRLAELERKAEAERKAREAAEAKAKAEREAAEKARKEAEAKAAAIEAERQKELAAERARIAEMERKEQARIEAEQVEAKRAALAAKKAAAAPDREKIQAWIKAMAEIEAPKVKDADMAAAVKVIEQKRDGFVNWALNQVSK